MLRRSLSCTLFPYTTLFRSLWDAIDQHRLTPFEYFGIADDLDLREIPFTRGRGYDVDAITNLITDRKSTRLNSSHVAISYAVFCLKKKKKHDDHRQELR